MTARARPRGFTLIEMMIVVAIVAILAMIAYPSYVDQVRKSRRAEAMAILLDIQLKQEKWRASNTTYGTRDDVGGQASNDYYDFDVADYTATTYTVIATAKAGKDQVNDKQSGTSCTPLTINQNGNKTPEACWQK